MPNIRTTCPSCDVVVVESPALTVRLDASSGASQAMFVCPDCGSDVIHPLDEHMIPVLIGAGCPIYGGAGLDPTGPGPVGWHPAFGPDISQAEIDEFVAELDRFDWFDDLAR